MKPQTTVHYCGPCKVTTKHNDFEKTSICQRCGVIKTRVRPTAPIAVAQSVAASEPLAWKQTA